MALGMVQEPSQAGALDLGSGLAAGLGLPHVRRPGVCAPGPVSVRAAALSPCLTVG